MWSSLLSNLPTIDRPMDRGWLLDMLDSRQVVIRMVDAFILFFVRKLPTGRRQRIRPRPLSSG